MNLIGKILNNRYEILEKIGNGGMATVYRAKDHVLNRFDAIKFLKDEFTTDSEFIKKFKSEAQAAASLTHPNIVQIFDVCNEDNLYYIVMELIQGKTLKEIINEDGVLSWKWSVNIAIQIASALETAHRNNIIHRDIKPHNIIITEDGIAKVTDFGIAKAVSNSTITAFGTTIGSVHYFSPEHARGGYTDAKSDIYSLGIVMYEMLTGKVPFDADTPVSVALKQVQEEPVDPIKLNPNIPLSVNRIILKAMQKDPNHRYQNATEMLKDLSMALKNPTGDFVNLNQKSDDSPTQKIPTIYELEKNSGQRIDNSNSNDEDFEEDEEESKSKNKFFRYLDEHKWAKVLFIIFITVAIFVIAMLSTIAILNGTLKGSRPEQKEMVNVSGLNGATRLTKEEAVKTLNEAGFTDITIEEEYSDDVEVGYIISQKPEAKENYNYNLTQPITLVVSKGKKIVTLPKKMVGKKISDVTDELDELDVSYSTEEVNDEKVEAGIVISTEPKEGEEISAATEVKLTVSKGSAYKDVVVPSVINNTEEQARQALSALNLVVNVSYEEDASKSDGVVSSQSVPPSKTVKEGTSVDIVVNKQPKKSTVTVNVNLKSVMNYTEPKPVTTYTNTIDEYGNTVVTNTTTTPEVEKATVVIQVGDDTILKDSYLMTRTDITKSFTTSGVKEVKVKVNDVTKFTQTIDFNKGDQVVNVN